MKISLEQQHHGNTHNSDNESDPETHDNELFSISKELLEQEKAFHSRNKTLQKKSMEIVKHAEAMVKEGKQILELPFSKITAADNQVSEAAEDQSGPSRARRSTYSNNSSKKNTEQTRPSTAKPRSSRHERNTSIAASGNQNHQIQPNQQPSLNIDENMGQEAMNRLLKAKLQVLQQDFDRMTKFYKAKDTSLSGLEQRLKQSEEEKAQALKTNSQTQSQVEKLKKQNEDLKKKNETLQTSCTTLKREFDAASKGKKQSDVDTTAQNVRLNRSLEEIEKYKALLAKVNGESRDQIEHAKRSAEGLLADLKKSEKQKAELLAVFKKQQQLIEVLKRQKIHIEAAKLLQFTEEEFLRALNSS